MGNRRANSCTTPLARDCLIVRLLQAISCCQKGIYKRRKLAVRIVVRQRTCRSIKLLGACQMNAAELPSILVRAVRIRPVFFVLLTLGAFMPFVVFGCSGYIGFPDWRRTWFSRFEMPLMALGFLCCLTAPWFAGGSIGRRSLWSGLAIIGFLAASLIASLTALIAFGIPRD
jgi:hypothetical protein